MSLLKDQHINPILLSAVFWTDVNSWSRLAQLHLQFLAAERAEPRVCASSIEKKVLYSFILLYLVLYSYNTARGKGAQMQEIIQKSLCAARVRQFLTLKSPSQASLVCLFGQHPCNWGPWCLSRHFVEMVHCLENLSGHVVNFFSAFHEPQYPLLETLYHLWELRAIYWVTWALLHRSSVHEHPPLSLDPSELSEPTKVLTPISPTC